MVRLPVSVIFLPAGTSIEAMTGDTILDAALQHGVPLEHECGGNCTCTTCHVHVIDGIANLTQPEDPESYRLRFAEDRIPESRLACQALLLGPVIVFLPESRLS